MIKMLFYIFGVLCVSIAFTAYSMLNLRAKSNPAQKSPVSKPSYSSHNVTLLVQPATGKRTFRYNRDLCSGMGDRLTVYQSIAALAYAVNATCFAYWCEQDSPSRFYSWMELSKSMRYPTSLVILSKTEFLERTAGMDELGYEGGLLPATLAYDGVYTLAIKTMILPANVTPCTQPQFEAAYKAIGGDWGMMADVGVLPGRYIALHIRGGDKIAHRDYHYTVGKISSFYCTREILQKIEQKETVPVVLISDDPLSKRLVLSEFGHVFTVVNGRGLTKLQQEMRDMSILLNADAIIQESPNGWSAFSSFAAMVRGIPLLNTWRQGDSLLDRFAANGGKPWELMTCDSMERFTSLALSHYKKNL